MNRKSLSEVIADERKIQKGFNPNTPKVNKTIFGDNALYRIDGINAVICDYFEEAKLVQSLNALNHDNFPFIYLPSGNQKENFLLKEYVFSFDLKSQIDYMNKSPHLKEKFDMEISNQIWFMFLIMSSKNLISKYDDVRIYYHKPRFISYLIGDEEIIIGPYHCTVLDYSSFKKSEPMKQGQNIFQFDEILNKFKVKNIPDMNIVKIKRNISVPIPDNLDMAYSFDCLAEIQRLGREIFETYDYLVYTTKVLSKFSNRAVNRETILLRVRQAKDFPRAEYVQYLTEEINEFAINTIVIRENNKVYDAIGNDVGEAFFVGIEGRIKTLLKINGCNGREYGVLNYCIDNTQIRFKFFPENPDAENACKKLNMIYNRKDNSYCSEGKFFGYKIAGYSPDITRELEKYFSDKGVMPFDPKNAPYPEFDLTTTGSNEPLPICRMCDGLDYDKYNSFVFGYEKKETKDVIFGVVKGYFFIYPNIEKRVTGFIYQNFSLLDCEAGFCYVTIDIYENGQISNIRPCENKTFEILQLPLNFYFDNQYYSDKLIRQPYIGNSYNYNVITLERAQGCLLGAAVGDALGTTYEFELGSSFKLPDKLEVKGEGPFKVKAGQVTDDTEMALGLARSLVKYGLDLKNIAKTYVEWMTKSKPYDSGFTTQNALAHGNLSWRREDMEDSTRKILEIVNRLNIKSLSNGSLMRVTPLAIYTYGMDTNTWFTFTIYQSQLTHANVEVSISVCTYIHAIHVLMGDMSFETDSRSVFENCKRFVKNFPPDMFPRKESDNVSKAVKRILKIFEYVEKKEPLKLDDGKVVQFDGDMKGYYGIAFYLAFECLLEDYSYEESMRKVIQIGGDTDTNAAIVGGLIGARSGLVGIPEDWWRTVINCVNPRSIKDKIVPDNAPKSQKGYYPSVYQGDLLELAEELLYKRVIHQRSEREDY